jgi:rhodanese-related sulfurtransferase
MTSRTPQEVAALGDAVIVDVREDDELARLRVPGTIHIPMSAFVERIGELPEGEVHVLCRSGARSGRVAAYLEQQGHEAVNVDGGILAWQAAGLPTEGDGPA